jgi:hypothetical protein
VVERLLLDRIHSEAAGTTVGGKHDPTVFAAAHKTEATLPLVELASPRTELADDPSVV